MSLTQSMLGTHPRKPAYLDVLSACIAACYDCAQICTACADACLSEKKIAPLIDCIRLDQDCAEICLVTGALLSRIGGASDALRQEQLRVCLRACQDCETECAKHAQAHEHCRICAQACRTCREACERLLEAPPKAH